MLYLVCYSWCSWCSCKFAHVQELLDRWSIDSQRIQWLPRQLLRIRLFSMRNADPTAALCFQVPRVAPVSNTAASQLVCAHEWAGKGLVLAVLTGVGDDALAAGRLLDEMLAHRLHHARRSSDTSCRSSEIVSSNPAPSPARRASPHSLCYVAIVFEVDVV